MCAATNSSHFSIAAVLSLFIVPSGLLAKGLVHIYTYVLMCVCLYMYAHVYMFACLKMKPTWKNRVPSYQSHSWLKEQVNGCQLNKLAWQLTLLPSVLHETRKNILN